MRKLLVALFAAVMIAALFVTVARSISTSPVETGAPYALEAEAATPGLAEAERLACASCSHADLCTYDYLGAETEIVRGHSICAASEVNGARLLANGCIKGNCNHRHEASAYPTGGYSLKLPMVADVNSESNELRYCNASAADCVEVEVLQVVV